MAVKRSIPGLELYRLYRQALMGSLHPPQRLSLLPCLVPRAPQPIWWKLFSYVELFLHQRQDHHHRHQPSRCWNYSNVTHVTLASQYLFRSSLYKINKPATINCSLLYSFVTFTPSFSLRVAQKTPNLQGFSLEFKKASTWALSG
jgi:hypothetical protein